MQIKDLIIFIAICDERSFTKASERLFISQSTLSKVVKKLEKDTDCLLLSRTNRRINITDEGLIFYNKSKEILNLFAVMNDKIKDSSNKISGEIRIGLPPIIGTMFFSSIAKEFSELYPEVDLIINETGGLIVEKLIEEEALDIGLCVLPTLNKNLESQMIFEDFFVVCVPKDHELSKRDEVSIAELIDEKFIMFDKSFAINRIVENACKREGFIPKVMFESTQWDFILELVSYNIGISIVPRVLFNRLNNINLVSLKIKEPHLSWQIGIVTKEGTYKSNAFKKLIDTIHQIYK